MRKQTIMVLYRSKVVFLLFIGLGITACSGNKARQDALKAEVIKIHDRIMPRTEEIRRAIRDLEGLIAEPDSLHAAFPSADTLAVRRQADSLILALENADNAMSDWMYEFNVDYTGMEHEKVMSYLEDQKKRIKEVEKAYNQSLGGAEKLLKQYKRSSK